MIVFDLRCSKDHTFEAWFRDSKTYDRQRRKGQVLCPVCADTKIEKALMAPNVSTSRAKTQERERAAAAEAKQFLLKLRRHIEENCEYVGSRFAEEARRIHYGEVDKRDIYGEATREEAAELRDEGVEFGEIPWLPAEN